MKAGRDLWLSGLSCAIINSIWLEAALTNGEKADFMKILQFPATPRLEKPGAGRRPETGSKTGGPETGGFEALLNRFKPAGIAEGPTGLVSLENLRARQLPPAGELNEAGRLLGRLDQAIRIAPSEVLSRVHDLEGLLYIYRTSP